MVTIGVYQLLINSDLYEHRCLENIQKLCKYSGKFDVQKQYITIIQAAIISTPVGITENCPISLSKLFSVKILVQENFSLILFKYWI